MLIEANRLFHVQESKLRIIAPDLKWKLLHLRWNQADDWKCGGLSNDNTISGSSARYTAAANSCPSWMPIPGSVGLDLHAFATWAFGSTGLPMLQILAYGDISQKGRFDNINVLLCRRPPLILETDVVSESEVESELDETLRQNKTTSPRLPYRLMTEEDWSLWDSIEGGFSMLEACPTEQLFER